MSKKKAWWKKISIKGIGKALTKAAAFITGGGEAASEPEGPRETTINVPGLGEVSQTVTLIGGAILILVIFMMLRRR